MTFRLSEKQWQLVAPIVAKTKRAETRGRPRQSDRYILDGILYMLEEGTKWRKLRCHNKPYPPFQSCHRRFCEWAPVGVLHRVIEVLARDMEERGRIPLKDCFFDNLFATASKDAYLMIQSNEPIYLGEPPPEPFPINMKLFFQTPKIWRTFFIGTTSQWIQQRLPPDLYDRARRL